MKKYGTSLLHRARDEFGSIEIAQEQELLCLYFGTSSRQSCMDPRKPGRLMLSYTRAMLASLLFGPAPRSALLIGLGGGSLLRFLSGHFPECRLTAVEKRPLVASLAQEYFGLPGGVTLFLSDGAQFVSETSERFDLVLIDAYDGQGLATSLFNPQFFSHSRRILTDEGWLSVNLWGDIAQPLQRIEAAFPQVWRLPVRERGNLIVLASPDQISQGCRTQVLRAHAEQLQVRLGLEFPQFLGDLRQSRRESQAMDIW